jgi:hypothetical protein
MNKFIYHHLGLGDHIVCNGLVRELSKDKNNEYYLFSYFHNKESIEFMFRDINNLKVIGVNSDDSVRRFIENNNIPDENIHVAGVQYKSNWFSGSTSFEESFYLQNNLNLNLKWDSFNVVRDSGRESQLKEILNISDNSDFIFIHDDTRFSIDDNKINSKFKKIRVNRGVTNNIFDYCSIIEQAKEVHVIESSFCFMIDLLKLNSYTYAHRYARFQDSFGIPAYKNIKQIIE